MDLGGGVPAGGVANVDLLSGGLDSLLTGGVGGAAAPSNNSLLGDIFGLGSAATTTFYIPPKQVSLLIAIFCPSKVGKGHHLALN